MLHDWQFDPANRGVAFDTDHTSEPTRGSSFTTRTSWPWSVNGNPTFSSGALQRAPGPPIIIPRPCEDTSVISQLPSPFPRKNFLPVLPLLFAVLFSDPLNVLRIPRVSLVSPHLLGLGVPDSLPRIDALSVLAAPPAIIRPGVIEICVTPPFLVLPDTCRIFRSPPPHVLAVLCAPSGLADHHCTLSARDFSFFFTHGA